MTLRDCMRDRPTEQDWIQSPLFVVRHPTTGHIWKVFEDGHTEGFPDDCIIDNRIPDRVAHVIAVFKNAK